MTSHPAAGASQRDYGTLADGRAVQQVTLSNGRGLVLTAITLGGIVTTLEVPDRHGQRANIVRGFDELADYVARNPFFGVIVGRYGNRIARGELVIAGETFELAHNDGLNCLHGGKNGFGTRLWEIESLREHDAALGGPAVTLRFTSPDGDEGFPGQLEARVTYSLGADQSWRIAYEATTDRATVVNLTHHDYFNLAGSGAIHDHLLTLPASRYNPIDAALIPTGIDAVEGTPFDFRSPTRIGLRVHADDAQLKLAGGYDHNWIIDAPVDGGPRLAALLEDPASGRTMAVLSTEPAIQFYSGNFLDGTLRGTGGEVYERGAALCLETQHSPDSPHHADWPSTLLRPGETYRSETVHRFGVAI